ncbi:MAG: (4Fe-4S)-binding protein [Flavobacteriaceae bacterium]
MKKTYQKDNLEIGWEAEKCEHAGVCVRTLPKVYNPKARPWIKPENASIEQLKSQISACPSGALSYREL